MFKNIIAKHLMIHQSLKLHFNANFNVDCPNIQIMGKESFKL